MVRNAEGFLMPQINKHLCVNCKLCDLVCPLQNGELAEATDTACLFYHADQEYRLASSSSGAFEAVCRGWVGEDEFSVFACVMSENGYSAYHTEVTTWEALQKQKKSKYVHSDTGNTYQLVKQRLRAGVKVVFVGTPCQVMGLVNYLGKAYQNLLTVDFVCHGTPSPLALKRYIESLEKQYSTKVTNFSFRHKKYTDSQGWSSLGIKAELANSSALEIPWDACEYMLWFLKGALSTECCYSCRFATTARPSDITLGDFWGVGSIHAELAEERTDGVSLVLLNTDKGHAVAEKIRKNTQVCWEDHPIQAAIQSNGQLKQPAERHPWRDVFYKELKQHDFIKSLSILMYGNIWVRAKRRLERLLKREK